MAILPYQGFNNQRQIPISPYSSQFAAYQAHLRRQQPQGGGLLGSFQQAADAARAANEQRYSQVLAGHDQRIGDAMGDLEGLGLQERADIAETFRGIESRTNQNLQAQGLSGTTVGNTLRTGIGRQLTDAQARLQERLRRERIGIRSGLQGDRLNFMERREDVGPDLGQMLALMQQMGQSSVLPRRRTVRGGSIGMAPTSSASSDFFHRFRGMNAPGGVTYGSGPTRLTATYQPNTIQRNRYFA